MLGNLVLKSLCDQVFSTSSDVFLLASDKVVGATSGEADVILDTELQPDSIVNVTVTNKSDFLIFIVIYLYVISFSKSKGT